jgi:hypothetical protein
VVGEVEDLGAELQLMAGPHREVLEQRDVPPTSTSFGRVTGKDNARRDVQMSIRYVF